MCGLKIKMVRQTSFIWTVLNQVVSGIPPTETAKRILFPMNRSENRGEKRTRKKRTSKTKKGTVRRKKSKIKFVTKLLRSKDSERMTHSIQTISSEKIGPLLPSEIASSTPETTKNSMNSSGLTLGLWDTGSTRQQLKLQITTTLPPPMSSASSSCGDYKYH